MENEQWKPVVGFEGYYEVSNAGRIRRIAPGGAAKVGGIRKFSTNAGGYYWVSLCKNGTQENHSVHRIVCRAFNGPPPDGRPFAAHRDGTRTNNAAANLYWASPRQNARDAMRHGRTLRGVRSPRAKLTEEDARKALRLKKTGMLNREIASLFGVATNTVSRIITGERWPHLTATERRT